MKLSHLLLLAGTVGLAIGGGTLFARSRADDAQTTYWSSGRLQSRVEYADGRPEGLAERWHASGELQARGRHVAGLMDGPWEFWLEDGSADVERSGTYRAGERVGPR